MTSDLSITIVQANLHWEDAMANRKNFDHLIGQIEEKTDVIVLPEMFTTGFSMEPQRVAEQFHPQEMVTLNWMRNHASQKDAVVCGSVSVEDNRDYYNRLFWVRPDGSFSMYDKRHTFTFAKEDQFYKRGTSLLIEEWRGWKICPLICYDLRFPVWSRNRLTDGIPMYDALIYVANWPAVRRDPWMKLLSARAIENQSYVVGCNRVGTDNNNHEYAGDSLFINPRGENLRTPGSKSEEILTVKLSAIELVDFRMKFPVLNDADDFQISH